MLARLPCSATTAVAVVPSLMVTKRLSGSPSASTSVSLTTVLTRSLPTTWFFRAPLIRNSVAPRPRSSQVTMPGALTLRLRSGAPGSVAEVGSSLGSADCVGAGGSVGSALAIPGVARARAAVRPARTRAVRAEVKPTAARCCVRAGESSRDQRLVSEVVQTPIEKHRGVSKCHLSGICGGVVRRTGSGSAYTFIEGVHNAVTVRRQSVLVCPETRVTLGGLETTMSDHSDLRRVWRDTP